MNVIRRFSVNCFVHSLKEHLDSVLENKAESFVHIRAIRLLVCVHFVNHCALRSAQLWSAQLWTAQLWTAIGNRYDQAKANRG